MCPVRTSVPASVAALFIQAMFEDSSRLTGDRKVTFDVTESDVSSTMETPYGTGDAGDAYAAKQSASSGPSSLCPS